MNFPNQCGSVSWKLMTKKRGNSIKRTKERRHRRLELCVFSVKNSKYDFLSSAVFPSAKFPDELCLPEWEIVAFCSHATNSIYLPIWHKLFRPPRNSPNEARFCFSVSDLNFIYLFTILNNDALNHFVFRKSLHKLKVSKYLTESYEWNRKALK